MHNLERRELSDHQEMYLKVIYALIEDHKVARVKEIAERLAVTKSSVSGALKSLAEKDLVSYDPYSYVELTAKGKKMAAAIQNKFQILTNFLVEVLEVPVETAEENACRMEHIMDDSVVNKLVHLLEFCKSCNTQCWKDESVVAVSDECCMTSKKGNFVQKN